MDQDDLASVVRTDEGTFNFKLLCLSVLLLVLVVFLFLALTLLGRHVQSP